MSNIINYPNGYTVQATDYVEATAADIYIRSRVESSILPCIFQGLQPGTPVGLSVPISGGTARGQDIIFTLGGAPYAYPLPTFLENLNGGPYNIICPANSTGYIVLNVAINPVGPTSNAAIYGVYPEDDDGNNVPVYIDVADRQIGVGSVFPYTQVVLCKVITNATDVVQILTNYDLNPTLTNRSYDYQVANSNAIQGIPTGLAMPYLGTNSPVPPGWILWSDGSIGNTGSGATILADITTYALFVSIWLGFDDIACPVSGGRGANPTDDFLAGKNIALPLVESRTVGSIGQGSGLSFRVPGTATGTETEALTSTDQLPSGTQFNTLVGTAGAGAQTSGAGLATVIYGNTVYMPTDPLGNSDPFSIVQPTTFVPWIIKL